MVGAKTNVTQWAAMQKQWLKAKRWASHDDCINNFAKKACLKAMKLTPKSTKGKFSPHNPELKRNTRKKRLFYAIAAGAGIKKGSGGEEVMKPAAISIYKRRVKSAGAIKAGFIECIKDLGFKNMRARTFAGGSASKSRGKLSKTHKLEARAFNNVSASGSVAYQPMEQAKRHVIQSEHEWAVKRLQRANNSFSSRKF
tara:strand:- start:2493 stop:3086 length:594 start_codon:yes stop_codon:yes gene_type:complete